MEEQESENQLNLAKAMLEHALNDAPTEFRLLSSADEFFGAKSVAKACRKLAKRLYKTVRRTTRDYAEGIRFGDEESIVEILSIKQVKDCADFYFREYETLKDMISEFRCYVRYGHRIRMLLLGEERPEEDMTDWRELPISFF